MKSAEWWAENWGNHKKVKAESKACFEANSIEPKTLGSREILNEIKRIHALGGRRLDDDEITEFYSNKKINLGRARIVAYKKRVGGRGRPPKNRVGTHEDLSYRAWLSTYHKRFVLPRLRCGSGYVNHDEIKKRFKQLYDSGVKRCKLVSKLTELLEAEEIKRAGFCLDSSTLRRILRATPL